MRARIIALMVGALALSVALGGCGPSHSPRSVRKSTAKKTETRASTYRVYDISDALIRFHNTDRSVTVWASIATTVGTEVVQLKATIDDGKGYLVDTQPLESGEMRMIGTVTCKDEVCDKSIVDLYINVDGHAVKRQFFSPTLAQSKEKEDHDSIAVDPEAFAKLVKRPLQPKIETSSPEPSDDDKQYSERLVANGDVEILDEVPAVEAAPAAQPEKKAETPKPKPKKKKKKKKKAPAAAGGKGAKDQRAKPGQKPAQAKGSKPPAKPAATKKERLDALKKIDPTNLSSVPKLLGWFFDLLLDRPVNSAGKPKPAAAAPIAKPKTDVPPPPTGGWVNSSS